MHLRVGLEPYPGYRLVQFLGEGGWGQVWKAENPYKRLVALKFLPGLGKNIGSSMEVRALNSIKSVEHKHILKTEHIWSCSEYLVICMELAEGSLHDLLDIYYTEIGTAMQPAHLCHFLGQAAEGIDYLNTRHHLVDGQRVAFRHCDIKPSNLLVTGSCVKVADFSLAFQTSTMSGHHARMGTLHYAAPEIFKGVVTEWSDQYALAVSYCQLRTGKLPFPPPPQRFTSTYQRPQPDLWLLPYGERRVLQRALDPVPQGRWRNCRDMMDQIRNSLREAPVPAMA